MTRKQLLMFFAYFDDRTDNKLVRFETKRLLDNVELPLVRYIENTVDQAIEPEMSTEAYFYTIANLASIRNSTFKLIADQYVGRWDEEKDELVEVTNRLLNSLGLVEVGNVVKQS